MSALKYLEIKAHNELLDSNKWKLLLETSLPLLTQFILRITLSRVKKIGIDNVLSSFQNSYWVSKKILNLMITEHEHPNSVGFGIAEIKSHIRQKFDWPVIQCWIAPNRTIHNDLMIVNKSISLKLYDNNNLISCPYYFDNVKCLIVNNMDSAHIHSIFVYSSQSRALKHLITYVRCILLILIRLSPLIF
ncbi:unnamed protein product [Rotaria sordida]|uniref:Uncharacterized protein n=1 Tax=Rotaria sordida TaxID=392033 RepID=A0A815DQG6_9BILA|nr:unnamed protein product [Rotaria sordida]